MLINNTLINSIKNCPFCGHKPTLREGELVRKEKLVLFPRLPAINNKKELYLTIQCETKDCKNKVQFSTHNQIIDISQAVITWNKSMNNIIKHSYTLKINNEK